MELFNETKIGTVEAARRQPKVEIQVIGKGGGRFSGDFHLISQASQAAADVQIDRTFGGDILVTAFGQKMVPMQISCLSIPRDVACGNVDKAGGTSMAQFYNKYNAGNRGSSTIPILRVGFDGVRFEGILVGLRQRPYTLSDSADIDLFAYDLTIQGSYS